MCKRNKTISKKIMWYLIHSLSARRLLLISAPSCLVCLSAAAVSTPLSLPARSIRENFPHCFNPLNGISSSFPFLPSINSLSQYNLEYSMWSTRIGISTRRSSCSLICSSSDYIQYLQAITLFPLPPPLLPLFIPLDHPSLVPPVVPLFVPDHSYPRVLSESIYSSVDQTPWMDERVRGWFHRILLTFPPYISKKQHPTVNLRCLKSLESSLNTSEAARA